MYTKEFINLLFVVEKMLYTWIVDSNNVMLPSLFINKALNALLDASILKV